MAFSDLNPTEEEFGQLLSHFQGVWSPVKRTWEIVDSYVEQTKSVWETNAKRARRTSYKSPRAANIIRHFVNSQAAYAPRVHREPLGRGAAQRAEADELEEGLIAALIDVGRKNPLLPWKSVFRSLAQYDYSVIRVGADIVHWEDIEPGKKDFSDDSEFDLRHRQWERSRLHHNPLTLDVPHPTRVLMDPNEKNPPFAIHTHTMEAHKVRELVISREGRDGVSFGNRNGPSFPTLNGSPYETMEIQEFWSEKWHKFFHNGGLVFEEPNTWGFNPYFHAFGGQGAEGEGVNGLNPEHLARPMLMPVTDILLIQMQQMNARHQVIMDDSYTPMRTSGDATQLAEALNEEGIVEDTDRDDVGFIETRKISPWLFQEEEGIERDIQEATQSTSAVGMRQPGVVTVGQESILQSRIGNNFADARQQVEDLATHASQGYLQLIETLTFGGHISDDGIRFGQHRIRSSQINGDYNTLVTFELVDPVLLLQEKQLALSEVQAGLMSRDRYWTISRLENRTEERDNLLEDEIDKDPRVHSILVEKVLREKGLHEFAEEERVRREEGGTANGTQPDLIDSLANVGEDVAGNQPAGGLGSAARAARQLRQPIGGVEGRAVMPDQRR